MWRMVSPTLSMTASFNCCSALIQLSRILFLIRATVICDAEMSSFVHFLVVREYESVSDHRVSVDNAALVFKACVSYWCWFRTRLKSPRGCKLRAFVEATS